MRALRGSQQLSAPWGVTANVHAKCTTAFTIQQQEQHKYALYIFSPCLFPLRGRILVKLYGQNNRSVGNIYNTQFVQSNSIFDAAILLYFNIAKVLMIFWSLVFLLCVCVCMRVFMVFRFALCCCFVFHFPYLYLYLHLQGVMHGFNGWMTHDSVGGL